MLIEVPTDMTVASTQTLQVHCSATGSPLPSIEWQREEVEIDTSGRTTIMEHRVAPDRLLSILEIQDTQPSDAGVYSCRAENEAGSSETTFQLTIICEFVLCLNNTTGHHFLTSCSPFLVEPNITHPTRNTTITAHYPSSLLVSLNCSSSGFPRPNVTWFRETDVAITCEADSQATTNDDSFPPPYTNLSTRCTLTNTLGSSILVVYNPKVEDSNLYTCVAESTIGMERVSVYLQIDGILLCVLMKFVKVLLLGD